MTFVQWPRRILRLAIAMGPALSANAVHAGIIYVSYDGTPSAYTCTLAQAINAANVANGLVAANYGSSTPAGNCSGALSGGNLIVLEIPTVTLTTIDNYWYGPNALPPIASLIGIVGAGPVTTIRAVHTGDPTPITANAFRFAYVSGGMELPAGLLVLTNVVLQGGYAKGGDSSDGGGGAGMGGAIFNQGSLTLSNVTLIGNTAQGGSGYYTGNTPQAGGGGMGQDGGEYDGGGFGGSLGGSYGGSGASGDYVPGGGGGGGGFIIGADAATTGQPFIGGAGGGNGVLGGAGFGFTGGAAGDGGGGGSCAGDVPPNGNGGNFGSGGAGNYSNSYGGSGGGGVGGGGGGAYCGGGGGFGGGGGGGGGPGNGGFGGGFGGFGGGVGVGAGVGGGGAGMGGAIFNHTGTVYLLNVTATGNAARGGNSGSGLGAVLFNLNGTVTIDFSTLAGNSLSGNNARADNFGPEDGTVYTLAYGNEIQDGSASSASLTIHSSIIHGTNEGTADDVVANVVNGNNTNASSVTFLGKNFIQYTYTAGGASRSGNLPSTADPLLGALSLYGTVPSVPLPVLPIGANSPAYNAATNCLEADGSTTLTMDARSQSRPQFSQCDIGAYEYDGDYIYADGFGPTL